MTPSQRLFLVQARTDFVVFELLQKQRDLPACHALHYLQMATEMLGKAYLWKHGLPKSTHRAFVGFLKSLAKNRKAQKQLGYEKRNESWKRSIQKSLELAQRIEDLAPALALDAPNPEYPWPRAAPAETPAEYTFGIWQQLQTPEGRQFLHLISRLFTAADAYL